MWKGDEQTSTNTLKSVSLSCPFPSFMFDNISFNTPGFAPSLTLCIFEVYLLNILSKIRLLFKPARIKALLFSMIEASRSCLTLLNSINEISGVASPPSVSWILKTVSSSPNTNILFNSDTR